LAAFDALPLKPPLDWRYFFDCMIEATGAKGAINLAALEKDDTEEQLNSLFLKAWDGLDLRLDGKQTQRPEDWKVTTVVRKLREAKKQARTVGSALEHRGRRKSSNRPRKRARRPATLDEEDESAREEVESGPEEGAQELSAMDLEDE
jgi:hypothetical protein